tara:strand:- start:63 stop:983 length:921 start_codon:yes stop_codon:yes gene_type:complete
MTQINAYNIKSIIKSKLLFNEPMHKHTTFGIGGNVACYIMPQTINELKNILIYSTKNELDIFFMGSGSNILVSDNGYDGIIISLKRTFKKIEIKEDGTIISESGVMLGSMVKKAINKGIEGMESLAGVPGTVGGALYMNAGAYNHEISNYFESARLLDNSGNEKIYKKSDIKFGYRYSSFPKNEILIEAIFKYPKGNPETILKNKKNASIKRKTSQPLNFRSAGSIFKNPNQKYAAGYLIDQSGLKGLAIGGAQISDKHANFIVNKGDAKAQDVLDLINIARATVLEKFNIKLELEIKLLGFSNAI